MNDEYPQFKYKSLSLHSLWHRTVSNHLSNYLQRFLYEFCVFKVCSEVRSLHVIYFKYYETYILEMI